ncbi:hypothetical protein B23_1981 [Geobacillus thermoleovorans B23]|nr:hypothetical protein B23_1981 [Geobacillus thermoleovorans B23]
MKRGGMNHETDFIGVQFWHVDKLASDENAGVCKIRR